VLIIHGVYRWRARKVAFRRDYCRACESGTLSVLVRTFNVFHVFWVPLLPLGAWGRWLCSRCGLNPHASPRTRRSFKIVLVVIAVLFNLAFWLAPSDTASPLEVVLMRGFGLAMLVLAIRWVVVHRTEPDFAYRLAAVQPYERWDCPLCGAQLMQLSTSVQCPSCDAEHRPLLRAA
jgi:hypothetical protein